MINICSSWEFTTEWNTGFAGGEGTGIPVRLPHNVRQLPLHYADRSDYEMLCGYRRLITVTPEMAGKRIFLQFDGAAHIAEVFANGISVTTHYGGYTAFRAEITNYVHEGENLIAVRLDSTENPSLPPFGFVIDYLTYGGLYREAWLDVREQIFINDIFVTTPNLHTADVLVSTDGAGAVPVRVSITDGKGNVLAAGSGRSGTGIKLSAPRAEPWSTESPTLYTLTAVLENGDSCSTDFGFRTVKFTADGLYLNGKKTYMRGLNRHQSWPYIGYAAAERLQREDARILKYELQCNAVRTSHYPQSRYFIDECDRIGLLVFTEIPGWQHIGDKAWQDTACAHVREMVLQYRNHPSIVLWGVRINESGDNDGFYKRTNAIAHELDPSRPTSGVRYLKKSSLLEDVYAFNDFSHSGLPTAGCRPKGEVTPDMGKALIISEHNGHMFPTKSFDNWERRQEHALRHARVHDAAMADGKHAGCFGWCMFDYQTHADFGSGDRMCYHGVMDAFRNPKLAAAAYSSQGELAPVLEIGSSMDIGDFNGGILGSVYVFTNADSVKVYKNDVFVREFFPKGWKGLRHGPIIIDDMVGSMLETQEGFSPAKAALVRDCLNSCRKYDINNLPINVMLKLARAMQKYKLTFDDAKDLYGRYVANWGGSCPEWRFEAISRGKTVKTAVCGPAHKLRFEISVSSTELFEGEVYDMSSVRVRIVTGSGQPAVYAQLPVSFALEGNAELIGPAAAAAEGGMCGTYIKTTGVPGSARLTVSAPGIESAVIDFTIRG